MRSEAGIRNRCMLTTTVFFPDMMRGDILPMKDKDMLFHYDLFHEIPDMKASPQIRIVLVSYAVDHAARHVSFVKNIERLALLHLGFERFRI